MILTDGICEWIDEKPLPKAVGGERVHATHCCAEHERCKYGEDDCPVVNKWVEQEYPCNCEWMW